MLSMEKKSNISYPLHLECLIKWEKTKIEVRKEDKIAYCIHCNGADNHEEFIDH